MSANTRCLHMIVSSSLEVPPDSGGAIGGGGFSSHSFHDCSHHQPLFCICTDYLIAQARLGVIIKHHDHDMMFVMLHVVCAKRSNDLEM